MRHTKYFACVCLPARGGPLSPPRLAPSSPFCSLHYLPPPPQFHQSTQPLHHVSYCMFYYSVPVPVTSYQKLDLVSSTQNQETSCL